MKAILIVIAYLALTGCVSVNQYGSRRIVDTPSGGKVSASAYREAERACADYFELERIDWNLYGPYGDTLSAQASTRKCMEKHGVRTSYRQPDGRRTYWEFPNSTEVK